MKRFWYTWLLMVANATLACSASAQQDWNQPSDIGSYQSIMSRAGINQGGGYDLGHQTHSRIVDNCGPVVSGQNVEVQGRAYGFNGNGVIQGSQGNGAVQHGTVNGAVNNSGNGGQILNGSANGGSAVQGQELYGGQAMSGRATGSSVGPVYNAAPTYAPVVGGAQATYFESCDQGFVGDSVGGMMGGNAANWVLGSRALFFTRNGESPVPLSRNGAGGVLLSTANDYGTMPGAEASLTRRTCNGVGQELRYWGLFPNQRDVTFSGPGLDSYLTGLTWFSVAPGPTNVLTYFNAADNHRIYRNNDVHSLEMNALRNGGNYTTLRGRSGSYELLGGVRWFQFNEDYRYAAFAAAGTPTQINYDLATRNTLLGLQVGARNESCLTDRLSWVGGTRVGLFNNRSISRQSIYTETGALAYLTGDPTATYNFNAQRDSLAMLGELDMGLAYRFTQKMRANIGYRLVGVSGVALAPNQIPRNFLNPAEMQRVKANDSLILGGGYAGLEMCF